MSLLTLCCRNMEQVHFKKFDFFVRKCGGVIGVQQRGADAKKKIISWTSILRRP